MTPSDGLVGFELAKKNTYLGKRAHTAVTFGNFPRNGQFRQHGTADGVQQKEMAGNGNGVKGAAGYLMRQGVGYRMWLLKHTVA